MNRTLLSMTADADLIVAGTAYQEIAGNITESHGLPLAEVHHFPVRANSQLLPVRLPKAMVAASCAAGEWVNWQLLRPGQARLHSVPGLHPAAGDAHRLRRRTGDPGLRSGVLSRTGIRMG
jgi:hypothetical protein